jgi:hypothetical protein
VGYFEGKPATLAAYRSIRRLESLISVASRAADIFERSKTDKKRQLIAFMFSNLRLRGKKLEFALRSPFYLMVGPTDYQEWLGRQDSNLGITGSKPVALPLGYAPLARRSTIIGKI